MFQAVQLWLGLCLVVMITNIDVSQEIFAMDMLKALKSSLKHRRKHVLRPLQLYGDQAMVLFSSDYVTILCPNKQQTSDNSIVKENCFIIEMFHKSSFSGIPRRCLSI